MAFALGEKDNRTFLGTVYKMGTRLCWLTPRRPRIFNTRGTHFWGLYAFNRPRFSSSPFTIQHHEVSTNAHGIPFLVRYTLA
jgi:hypothetical protein